MGNQFEAGMRSLRESVKKIESLSAWLDLMKSETSLKNGASYQMHDPTEHDLKCEYGYFLYISMDLKSALRNLSKTKAETYNSALQRLDRRVAVALRNTSLKIL